MPQALAVIGAVVGTGATIASVNTQRKMAKEQQRQQQLATRQSQRQAIREAQIRRAQTLATGQASGAVGSSGVAGGTASLGSQVGGSLGFASQMSGLSANISNLGQRASTLGAISGLGFQMFDTFGGANALFGGGKQAAQPDLLSGVGAQ
jgi:hypothetical protein